MKPSPLHSRAASAIAALAASLLALSACGEDPDAGRLVLAGTIEARTVEVGSLVGGRVAAVEVDEGSEVEAGQLLVVLEPDLVDRRLDGQRARVAQAEAELELALEGPRDEALRRARIEWEAAKTDLRRLEALFADGVTDEQRRDAAAVREATARETVEELERGSRNQEIAAARAAVDVQRAEVAHLERQRAELEVRAPAAGRVESIDLRPGDLVGPNQPVASILEPDELWVRVYVPEPSLGRVAIGQAAELRVDTFAERTFAGRVVEIRHQAEYLPRNVQTLDQRSDQVFAVKVAVEPGSPLRPGMAVFATLVEDAKR